MKSVLPVALCLLTSCITVTPRSQHASPSAKVLPNMSMHVWGVESCGAGSLSTVLQHYGDTTSMEDWDTTLPKTRGGVLTVDILLAARRKGYDASLVTGDRDTVTGEIRDGRPVILMLQVIDAPGHAYDFFHYIVVDGIDPAAGLIRTQFGDGRARWVSIDRIEKAWSGGGHAAILIHPRDPLTDSIRAAVALEDEGKPAEAADADRAILATHPESLLVWTNLGNAEMQVGHTAAAEDAFRHALALDPNARDALNNLAWLLLRQKRLDEAESLARKAVAQRGPDPYLVLDTLARILAAKGSCDEAVTTFRQAIDAVPSSHANARQDIEKALADTHCG